MIGKAIVKADEPETVRSGSRSVERGPFLALMRRDRCRKPGYAAFRCSARRPRIKSGEESNACPGLDAGASGVLVVPGSSPGLWIPAFAGMTVQLDAMIL